MKVLIIGHKGSYGKWLYDLMSTYMTNVEVSGIDSEATCKKAIFKDHLIGSDVVIISVPLYVYPHILSFVLKHINNSSLVVDIASSKKELVKLFKKAKCDYLMLHPMCAPPDTKSRIYPDKKVYAIDASLKEVKNREFYSEFKELIGGEITGITLEKHDIIEELNQTTIHMSLLNLLFAIDASGFTFEEAKEHSTPVALPLYESLERMMIHGNPYTTAKLVELGINKNSKIVSAFMFYLKGNKKPFDKIYFDNLAKKIEEIRKKLFEL